MTVGKSKKILALEKILRVMAVLVLKKYKPQIISITGSVGKTSAKEAIFSVIHGKFRVRKTAKNYNNEIGVPLTIIGAESGGNSLAGWLLVFLKWIGLMLSPFKYPEILVLEMGADRPGDIEYLTSFVRSDMAIITDISWSHVEFFKTVEGVAKEKGILAKTLEEKGTAILNIDNQYIAKIANQLKCNVVSFGFSQEADMKATSITFSYDGENRNFNGLSFKLDFKGTSIPVRLPLIIAKHQIYAALAGAAVGTRLDMNLVEIGAALEKFSSPRGRMNILKGVKGSFIIDDTYNSSPNSVEVALNTLGEIADSSEAFRRKIVALGDMLEIGDETQEKHEELAKKFLSLKGDVFFAVGERMKFAVEELKRCRFPEENIFHFEDPMEAGRKLQEIVGDGDLILVKGSQGMRMEKVVEEIMAEPQEAEKLLCRQSEDWKRIPWKKV